MAKLNAKTRKSLPKSAFALPNMRAFPLTDANHDRAALQDVNRSLKAGHITSGEAKTVKRKASAALKKATGKRAAPARNADG